MHVRITHLILPLSHVLIILISFPPHIGQTGVSSLSIAKKAGIHLLKSLSTHISCLFFIFIFNPLRHHFCTVHNTDMSDRSTCSTCRFLLRIFSSRIISFACSISPSLYVTDSIVNISPKDNIKIFRLDFLLTVYFITGHQPN